MKYTLRYFALGFCIAFWALTIWALSGCALTEPPTFADQVRTETHNHLMNFGVWRP